MNDIVKGFRKIVFLSFPPEVSGRPVVCNLAKLFDLSFNILKAQINPRQDGALTLEIMGLEENFQRAQGYLKENGVKISSIAQRIFRDEETCVHCGVCTAMCPTHALSLDRASRQVLFEVDKCSACGLCTRICPMHAMNVELDENSLLELPRRRRPSPTERV